MKGQQLSAAEQAAIERTLASGGVVRVALRKHGTITIDSDGSTAAVSCTCGMAKPKRIDNLVAPAVVLAHAAELARRRRASRYPTHT